MQRRKGKTKVPKKAKHKTTQELADFAVRRLRTTIKKHKAREAEPGGTKWPFGLQGRVDDKAADRRALDSVRKRGKENRKRGMKLKIKKTPKSLHGKGAAAMTGGKPKKKKPKKR